MVALNLGDAPASLSAVNGTIRIGTRRSRAEEVVDGELTLAAGEGAIVLLDVLPG